VEFHAFYQSLDLILGGRNLRSVGLHLSTKGMGRAVTLDDVFSTSDRWNILKQVEEASSMSVLSVI
jgi:predicted DNA-binding ribbon-helix-helix protein